MAPKPPPVPVVDVQASPVIGVPTHGSSVGNPPPWPVVVEPPVEIGPDPPTVGDEPPLFEEPPVPGGIVLVPAVPVLRDPAALDELPPLFALPPGSSPELPPQAVAAIKPNTKMPNRCFINSPRVCELKTTLMVAIRPRTPNRRLATSTSTTMKQG